MFQGLKSTIDKLNRPQMPYEAAAYPYLRLDADAIAEDMGLDSLGRRHGEEERPTTYSTQSNETEQKITELIEVERHQTVQKYLERVEGLATRVNSFDIGVAVNEIRTSADTAVTEFQAETHTRLNQLQDALDEVNSRRRDLSHFQKEHGLKRGVLTKSGPQKFFAFSIMLAVLLTETVLNGSFLADGLQFGLAQGVLVAFGLSVVNVLVGAAAGHFSFRQCHHAQVSTRLIGAVGVVGWLCFIFAFNLLVGHYRGALGGEDPLSAATLAVETFVSAPWSLQDFQSYLLLIFGVTASAISAVDVFWMFDSYPGYERMNAKLENAKASFSGLKEELEVTLEDKKNEAIKWMNASIERLSALTREENQVRHRVVQNKTQTQTHIDHLETAANRLLKIYRVANEHARETPVPDYFKKAFKIQKLPPGGESTINYSTKSEVKAKLDEATQIVQEDTRRVNEVYLDEIRKISSMHRQFNEMRNAAPQE